ncbi:mechanosensitive ion channel family protein [Peribacillus kribbensis]|uniref:mechanosensitive ion channel family protein n=1 Tax=Peribacillus kribbensis TaxID=356658 RepID=UPI00040BD66A|nr:mechanosensitive ion channel domain-containing protein [Peribacillus kribbensis]
MLDYAQGNHFIQGLEKFDYGAMAISFGVMVLKILAIIIILYAVRAIALKIIHKSFRTLQSGKKVSAARVRTLESLTQNVAGYVFIFILIVTILQVLGIKATAVLAGAGVVGLAVGFGAQGLVSDVVTGFFLLLERQVEVGEHVTIGNFTGIVEQIGLRTTLIRGFDGTLYFVQNRGITNVSNHSRANMKDVIDVIVPCRHNLDAAQELVQKVFNDYKNENTAILDGPSVIAEETPGKSDNSLRILARVVSGQRNEIKEKLLQLLHETLQTHQNEIQ